MGTGRKQAGFGPKLVSNSGGTLQNLLRGEQKVVVRLNRLPGSSAFPPGRSAVRMDCVWTLELRLKDSEKQARLSITLSVHASGRQHGQHARVHHRAGARLLRHPCRRHHHGG